MSKFIAMGSSGVAHERAKRIKVGNDVYAAYIGLDVHKASLAVAIAHDGRQESEFIGEIPNTGPAVAKLVGRLNERFAGERLLFSYEAGPCGYGLYHQIQATGHACEVVAPSLIPRRAGDRVKTDHRDAKMLARLSRSGELTPVWASHSTQLITHESHAFFRRP